MSELTRLLVLAGAFVAFILAAYLQEGGTWHGPHSLRKSLHPKSATVGLHEVRYGCDGVTGLSDDRHLCSPASNNAPAFTLGSWGSMISFSVNFLYVQ